MSINISNIRFHSDDHIRYENGKVAITSSSDSNGHNKGANRGIQVEPNINGGEGYTVTMFNLDGNHPVWGNNVQMAPKQMKIVSSDNERIVLRGFGYDRMGASFAEYGLTIYHNGKEPSRLVLHMHDRNIDIEYFRSNDNKNVVSGIEELSSKILLDYYNEKFNKADLSELYSKIIASPKEIANINNKANIGSCLLLFLELELVDSVYTLQRITNIAYLCLSDTMRSRPADFHLLYDRITLLVLGQDPFIKTIISVLENDYEYNSLMPAGLSGIDALHLIFKMQYSDLHIATQLNGNNEFLNQVKNSLDERIVLDYFAPHKTKESVFTAGMAMHDMMYNYLYQKIIVEGDINI